MSLYHFISVQKMYKYVQRETHINSLSVSALSLCGRLGLFLASVPYRCRHCNLNLLYLWILLSRGMREGKERQIQWEGNCRTEGVITTFLCMYPSFLGELLFLCTVERLMSSAWLHCTFFSISQTNTQTDTHKYSCTSTVSSSSSSAILPSPCL